MDAPRAAPAPAPDADPDAGLIQINVTRTRVTVLGFNLTIIVVMTSQLGSPELASVDTVQSHLTTYVSLFAGFCMTLLGLIWFLASQQPDLVGASRPVPYTFGKISMYLAVSHSVAAFMHAYLAGLQRTIDAPGVDPDHVFASPVALLGVLGGLIWLVVTYAGPIYAALRFRRRDRHTLLYSLYYLALQLPVLWSYMRAYELEDQPVSEGLGSGELFLLQFIQPVLWF